MLRVAPSGPAASCRLSAAAILRAFIAGALDQLCNPFASNPLDVLMGLEQGAERSLSHLWCDLGGTESRQGLSPVKCFADPGQPVEVEPAKLLYQGARLRGEALGHLRQPRPDYRHLSPQVRMLDPVIEAAASERVVQLPGPVR